MNRLPSSASPQERFLPVIGLLAAVLAGACLLALASGSVSISLLKAFRDPSSMDGRILFGIRLPWLGLAVFTGAGLSVVGAGFQALLRNPLADPYILGMSGGASLGAVLFLTLGLHTLAGPGWLPAAGFTGALGATWLVWSIARRQGGGGTYAMLLAGVVVNAIFGALIMFLISMARPDAVHHTAIWLMGVLDVFHVPPLLRWTASALCLACIAYFWLQAPHLNTLSLGDWTASTLGTNPGKTRFRLFLAGAVIVGGATSIAGPIGFVGLIVPHVIRMVWGADHRLLIPASALGGAAFLVLAGTAARAVFPVFQNQVPVGVLTAALGGPFFLWILARSRHG